MLNARRHSRGLDSRATSYYDESCVGSASTQSAFGLKRRALSNAYKRGGHLPRLMVLVMLRLDIGHLPLSRAATPGSLDGSVNDCSGSPSQVTSSRLSQVPGTCCKCCIL